MSIVEAKKAKYFLGKDTATMTTERVTCSKTLWIIKIFGATEEEDHRVMKSIELAEIKKHSAQQQISKYI